MPTRFLLGASILAVAAGCSSNADSGGGGGGSTSVAAGGGGFGGGGVGGGGGSGAAQPGNACTAEETAALLALDYPELGFDDDIGDGQAIVAAATAVQLELTLTTDGSTIHFAFAGADLTTAFTVGEEVTLHPGWISANGGAAAVVLAQADFSSGVFSGDLPASLDAPALDLVEQCGFLDPESNACGLPPRSVRALAVSAALGADAVTVEIGEGAPIGPWTLHNLYDLEWPAYGSPEGCIQEGSFSSLITLLKAPD